MMPDFMLARLTIVLENGNADPGTGHAPTSGAAGLQLSKSPFWTKFRRGTQEWIFLHKTSWPSRAEVQPGRENVADGGIKFLCT
jgi:hypothetical protein